jgi:hypothetical protein
MVCLPFIREYREEREGKGLWLMALGGRRRSDDGMAEKGILMRDH